MRILILQQKDIHKKSIYVVVENISCFGVAPDGMGSWICLSGNEKANDIHVTATPDELIGKIERARKI